MALATAMVTALRADDRTRFDEILVESFPADERDRPEQVIANIEQGRRRCMLTYDDDALVGFAVLLDLPAVDMILLEYMAVAADARNRGVGGHLVDAVFAELAGEPAPCAGLVLEVEPPDVVSGEEQRQRQRRINFYESHGARVILTAPAYRVPSTTGPEALPFLLMWLPLAATEIPAGERLRRVVEAVLVAGHELHAGDAFVRRVLAELRS